MEQEVGFINIQKFNVAVVWYLGLQGVDVCVSQIDSSAIVEMEVIGSDESDYEADFTAGEPPPSRRTRGNNFPRIYSYIYTV